MRAAWLMWSPRLWSFNLWPAPSATLVQICLQKVIAATRFWRKRDKRRVTPCRKEGWERPAGLCGLVAASQRLKGASRKDGEGFEKGLE